MKKVINLKIVVDGAVTTNSLLNMLDETMRTSKVTWTFINGDLTDTVKVSNTKFHPVYDEHGDILLIYDERKEDK